MNHHSRWYAAACILLALLRVSAPAGPTTVAVLDFQNTTGDQSVNYLRRAVPELLITSLVLSNKLTMLERTRLGEALKEMGLSQSGAVDSAKALEAGKLAGARVVVLGSIHKTGSGTQVNARGVEVETGKILVADKIEWTKEDEVVGAMDDSGLRLVQGITGEKERAKPVAVAVDPPKATGKTVGLEVALDNRYRLDGADSPTYVRVDLFSREVKTPDRLPLNISLVMDRSGSMASQDKLTHVKKAAEFVVNHLEKNDVFSLVTYSTGVEVPLKSGTVSDKQRLVRTVRGIVSGGNTNLSGGMLEGYTQVAGALGERSVNRVLLLSDGLLNEGITDESQLETICAKKVGEGVAISTFGVGASYNEDLMQSLAEHGNGNYHFIANSEDIPEIFSKELKGLLAVTAQNAVVKLILGEGVQLVSAFGYITDKDDNEVSIRLGDLYSNDQITLILQLAAPKKGKGTVSLGSIELSYDDVAAAADRAKEQVVLNVEYTRDEKQHAEGENGGVKQMVGFMASNVVMEEAAKLVDDGEVDKARLIVDSELQKLSALANHYQTVDLKKQIIVSNQYLSSLEGYEERSRIEQKLMQKQQKLRSYEALMSK